MNACFMGELSGLVWVQPTLSLIGRATINLNGVNELVLLGQTGVHLQQRIRLLVASIYNDRHWTVTAQSGSIAQ